MEDAAITSREAATGRPGIPMGRGLRGGCGFGGARRVQDRAARWAGSEVRKKVGALAIEQPIFGKGSQLVRIGMRTGGLGLAQLSAQRVGGEVFHDADPSLL